MSIDELKRIANVLGYTLKDMGGWFWLYEKDDGYSSADLSVIADRIESMKKERDTMRDGEEKSE